MDSIFINRQIEKYIGEVLPYFPVLTITGPRQSGKTTLIKNLFTDYQYFSMENIDTLSYAISDPRGFLSSSPTMIIDEVQNAPALLSYIQGIVDEDNSRKFILSGSSQLLMLKHVTQSLAGRSAIIELMPMSFSEIADTVSNTDLNQLIYNGFYPAVCTQKNKPEYFYPNYVKTYIERDVRNILNVTDLHRFQIFMKLCAGRIGSLFNASDLSNEVGVSVNTIKSWLDVLQTSYIVTLLQPYYDNIGKRLVKTPKIYFYDTGLARYLLDIDNPKQLAHDKMKGHLFENMIVSEAIKHQLNKGKSNNLFFYRDSNKNEVDLLLTNGGNFKALEIKSAQTFDRDFLKGLVAFEKVFGNRVLSKNIVYAGDFENNGADFNLLNYRSLYNASE